MVRVLRECGLMSNALLETPFPPKTSLRVQYKVHANKAYH